MRPIQPQPIPSPSPQRLDEIAARQTKPSNQQSSNELKDAFQNFVGETFFQMMLKSMHATHGKPAYMHGGQAEEIFQSQLDQEMASDLAQNSGAAFADDLYELFALQLHSPVLETNRETIDAPRVATNDAV